MSITIDLDKFIDGNDVMPFAFISSNNDCKSYWVNNIADIADALQEFLEDYTPDIMKTL